MFVRLINYNWNLGSWRTSSVNGGNKLFAQDVNYTDGEKNQKFETHIKRKSSKIAEILTSITQTSSKSIITFQIPLSTLQKASQNDDKFC